MTAGGGVDPSSTDNIFIEGENLEVLKLLQKSYAQKVKMIYIDPPYNTGNDSFVYPDKFSQTSREYEQSTGDRDEDGIRVRSFARNSRENGHFHSNWLSMMYPRLLLARNLLKEDGVIFVSIDDNEVHNLRLLMNEVFGEENFVGNIAWESKTKSQNTKSAYNKLQPKIEHILVYSKNGNNRFNLISKGEKDYPNEDESGFYREYPLEVMNATGIRGRESMIYEIEGIFPPEGKQWQLGINQVATYKNNGNLFIRDGKIIIKMRPEEERGDITEPFWAFLSKMIGTAESAKKELIEMFGIDNIFDTVKPVELVKRLIFHTTNPNSNDIILDFFAGSGTTGQAVWELNQEDGGNRRFILVQLPEDCDPKSEAYGAGYKTIADITRERLIRAGKKIKSTLLPVETGFRDFKLTESHFIKFNGDTTDLQQELSLQLNPLKEGTSFQQIIFEKLLDLGWDLSSSWEKREHFYLVEREGARLIFLLEEVSLSLVEDLILLAPEKVLILESLLGSNDSLKQNLSLRLGEAGIPYHFL